MALFGSIHKVPKQFFPKLKHLSKCQLRSCHILLERAAIASSFTMCCNENCSCGFFFLSKKCPKVPRSLVLEQFATELSVTHALSGHLKLPLDCTRHGSIEMHKWSVGTLNRFLCNPGIQSELSMTTSGLTLAILSLVPVTRGRSHMAILNTYMLCLKPIPPIYSAVEPRD